MARQTVASCWSNGAKQKLDPKLARRNGFWGAQNWSVRPLSWPKAIREIYAQRPLALAGGIFYSCVRVRVCWPRK